TQFIDILALYSNQEAPLGQPTLLSHIDAHIAATNQAFANSGIPIVLRLVGLLGAGYSESGNLKTDLNELAFSSDVATARNRFGADLVVLMDSAGTQSDDTIGIATVLTSQTSSLKNRAAFIVIDDSQPADSDVLAHEVGHTLGAAHAVGDPQGGGATRYARGYRFIGQDGQQYHDIMAYAPGIPIPYFSNPGITYQGVPEGNAATGDASRAISEDASIVAGYRAAKPIGAIDNATLTTLTGDAFDPRTSDPLTLRVDIDNKTHDTFLADESRDNLTAQFGVTVHGFTYTIPRLTQGNHTIKIYALDPFTGAAVLIATKTISSPSPLFDESYYLANNPDVVTLIAQGKYKSGWDEFQKVGQFQGRDPSLYFNTQYYLANNPDLAALSAKGKLSSPFANYVSSGQFHHRPASALFDEAFYLSTNPSVTPALLRQYKSPIMQFLLQGSYQGLLAVPPA
ncbi:MAG TPA: zinc-dependent metalloprotease family protein, partial [Phycisphaerae bacterium]